MRRFCLPFTTPTASDSSMPIYMARSTKIFGSFIDRVAKKVAFNAYKEILER